ncbi:phospholipase effector Tle1 domain-containing protein [Maribacter sp. 2308TA10-17]|uniref:phospholipase effector Tle1 domain-containing protein n=1 Tax=Maribacter sp. 2308TA10-17 TaxID=3386276 RepID=UPI0039BD31DB
MFIIQKIFVNRIAECCLVLIIPIVFSACGSKKATVHKPVSFEVAPKKLAVFMDGTTNNESSHTNVSKLYNLVTLQNNPNVGAAYLRGVGNGADFVGILTGSGIRGEVCNGYLYLAEHYNHERKDEIYLFGFSRGAYAARILAGMIHSAGIVDVSKIPKDKRLKFIKKIYNAHKGNKTLQERRNAVFEVTQQRVDYDDYKIEFMGLWDTVASLGIPDYKDDYYVEETKYHDQLCNVKRASQALSLNDNRGSVFTPSILTDDYLVQECKEVKPKEIVNEVWFFGAHSDVGGGALNTNISGVSLNWMIGQLKEFELLPPSAAVYENRMDITNNPIGGMMKLFYPKKGRKLVFFTSRNGYKKEKLKIHQSVLDRLEGSLQTYEVNLIKLFGECFEKNNKGGYDYLESSACFDIEN